jgi:hypothetical protein
VVEFVNRRKSRWLRVLGGIFGLVTLGHVAAQAAESIATEPRRAPFLFERGRLPDPMRPTAAPITPAVTAGPATQQTRPAADSDAESAADAVPRLFSVQHVHGQQPLALLGRQWVRQGDMLGPWRVVQIGEESVHLSRGRDLRVLRLWPQMTPP